MGNGGYLGAAKAAYDLAQARRRAGDLMVDLKKHANGDSEPH